LGCQEIYATFKRWLGFPSFDIFVSIGMKTTTLQFENLLELERFLEISEKKDPEIDVAQLQLTAQFKEKDIELAKSAFAALIVIDEEEYRKYS
jgi:hypothetical protein